MRRKAISKRKSSKLFKRTANKTHIKNLKATPLRGGWSL